MLAHGACGRSQAALIGERTVRHVLPHAGGSSHASPPTEQAAGSERHAERLQQLWRLSQKDTECWGQGGIRTWRLAPLSLAGQACELKARDDEWRAQRFWCLRFSVFARPPAGEDARYARGREITVQAGLGVCYSERFTSAWRGRMQPCSPAAQPAARLSAPFRSRSCIAAPASKRVTPACCRRTHFH